MNDWIVRDPDGVRVIYRAWDGPVFGTALLGNLLPEHSYVFGFILPTYVMLIDGCMGLPEFLQKVRAPQVRELTDRTKRNVLIHEAARFPGAAVLGIADAENGVAYQIPTRVLGFLCNTKTGKISFNFVAGDYYDLSHVANLLQVAALEV